jgi:hypothetical protein
MSQSSLTDPFLLQTVAPPQELKLEQPGKSGYIVRMLTPPGRFSFCHLDKPHASGRPQPGKEPRKTYSVAALFNPAACGDIWRAICMVANAKWPGEPMQDANGATIIMNGEYRIRAGQLHSPLRDGMKTFMSDMKKYEAYRGTFHVNAGTGEDRAPVCYDEFGVPCPADKFYSGCYGRLYITIAAIPDQQPTKGITAYLQAAQFVAPGQKLSAFDAVKVAGDAFAAAPLPANLTGVTPGTGPNLTGSPWGGAPPAPGIAVSPGVPAGFAAPAAAPGAAPGGAGPWGGGGVAPGAQMGGAAIPGA